MVVFDIIIRNNSEAHMIVGKVVGSVVSTRKCEKLIGSKFMII